MNLPMSFPSGVIPACLLPFQEDFSIDEASWKSHLRDLAAVDGSAITINGHSCEVHADEQRRIVAFAKETVGERTKIVTDIYSESSLESGAVGRKRCSRRKRLSSGVSPAVAGSWWVL